MFTQIYSADIGHQTLLLVVDSTAERKARLVCAGCFIVDVVVTVVESPCKAFIVLPN